MNHEKPYLLDIEAKRVKRGLFSYCLGVDYAPSLVPPEYWMDNDEDEHDDCATVNGANGDCPLGRDTCRSCRFNRRKK